MRGYQRRTAGTFSDVCMRLNDSSCPPAGERASGLQVWGTVSSRHFSLHSKKPSVNLTPLWGETSLWCPWGSEGNVKHDASRDIRDDSF